MAVTLRNSTPNDEDLLFRLFAENKAHEFALLGMGEEQLRFMVTMQYRMRCTGYAANYPNVSQQIVVEDGVPVGQILLSEDPLTLHVVDIAIAGTHRGRGLGTRVLRSVCERATAEGRSVRLRVIPQSAASRLYRSLGFVVTAHDPTGEEMLWPASATTIAQ